MAGPVAAVMVGAAGAEEVMGAVVMAVGAKVVEAPAVVAGERRVTATRAERAAVAVGRVVLVVEKVAVAEVCSRSVR